MAEEIVVKEKKSFKEKLKKALPWIGAGLGTIGSSILAYKFGKYVSNKQTELCEEETVARYLKEKVENVAAGGSYTVHVQNTKEDLWGTLTVTEKPDWADDPDTTHEFSRVIMDEVSSDYKKIQTTTAVF